ncbi:hypothetical protein M8818_000745 [Zalaria obscura]|uniref:Uncharacterized protein n=1 Tax=Zalaria obscura TaxID=2024903 RepID=A0ACC3SM52_9PEZI
MDSMRNLHSSLPRASPRVITQQNPQELLSAFKAAALSVTNLYKTAHSDQARSRAAGYQDALDDLLSFLDKQNLGLDDGEGWRVRQWATERLDGGASGGGAARGDSEDEEEEDEKPRSSSPEIERKPKEQQAQPEQDMQASVSSLEEQIPQRTQTQSEPPVSRTEPVVPRAEHFTFVSHLPYPTNHERQDTDMDNGGDTQHSASNASDTATPVRLEVLPRSNRRNLNRSNNSRSSTSSLGSGAGSKRKIPFGDFFDISGLSFDRKDDTGRSGKRGRHV